MAPPYSPTAHLYAGLTLCLSKANLSANSSPFGRAHTCRKPILSKYRPSPSRASSGSSTAALLALVVLSLGPLTRRNSSASDTAGRGRLDKAADSTAFSARPTGRCTREGKRSKSLSSSSSSTSNNASIALNEIWAGLDVSGEGPDGSMLLSAGRGPEGEGAGDIPSGVSLTGMWKPVWITCRLLRVVTAVSRSVQEELLLDKDDTILCRRGVKPPCASWYQRFRRASSCAIFSCMVGSVEESRGDLPSSRSLCMTPHGYPSAAALTFCLRMAALSHIPCTMALIVSLPSFSSGT
mmetsp:Transcript_1947/g.5359  ORF Transcript_1947/g.5359 Transcript_1947/m.5359 type:complete len:295 (-) Transcript_1947:119-1003(-)